ncbi:hypothetical protein HMPREF1640_04660 [Prevotella sp. S7-1-8]|nr:hypothetical protein HMPREF1640_04660 [Prevotella sp. S7-1-8]
MGIDGNAFNAEWSRQQALFTPQIGINGDDVKFMQRSRKLKSMQILLFSSLKEPISATQF